MSANDNNGNGNTPEEDIQQLYEKRIEGINNTIKDLVREIDSLVDSVHDPIDLDEWEAHFFRHVAMIQSRLSDYALSLDIHKEECHVDDDGNYNPESCKEEIENPDRMFEN